MSGDFIPSVAPDSVRPPGAWWFVYSDHRLLVKGTAGGIEIPFIEDPEKLGVSFTDLLFLGSFRGRPCYAAESRASEHTAGDFDFLEIRSLFDRLDGGAFEAALTGAHLVEWHRTYRFCARCRGPLRLRQDVRAKECTDCGRLEFPRLSPAIIVLIEKEDKLLLARSPRFAGEFFSVLAGFVEAGESLEKAVHREIMEEVGIEVKNVKYFGSQPWPFPDSLMIGFTAEYDSGDIRIDGEEIIEAGWYRADNLPHIPGRISIARQLIDWFVNKHSR
jgi:NAD+ diphosphatase